MKQWDDITIADMIVMAARRSECSRERERFGPIARIIPNVKHFRYDEALIQAVDRSRSIEAEEIIGNLKPDYLPFDRLWIYGPPISMGTRPLHPVTIQMGMFVEAHKSGNGFNVTVFDMERDVENIKTDLRKINREYLGFMYENKGIGEGYSSISTIVDSRQGILLDENKLLSVMEESEDFERNVRINGLKFSKDKFADITDIHYYAADFLARVFVLLGSGAAEPRVNWEKSPSDLRGQKLIRERIRMGANPRFTAEPITIDLAKVSSDLFEPREPAAIRDLPGWTAVRRSKEIVSKNGKVFTRAPHDRRIAAPVDRRNVERVLTNSNADLTLAIGPAGPQRVLGPLQQ